MSTKIIEWIFFGRRRRGRRTGLTGVHLESPDEVQPNMIRPTFRWYLQLFEKFLDHQLRLENSLNEHLSEVSDDKGVMLETPELDASKRITDLSNLCRELEDQLKVLRAETDMEKYLKQGAESSFEMMKVEYVRVTSVLQEKCFRETQQLKDILEQTVRDNARETERIKDNIAQEMDEKMRRIEELEDMLEQTRNVLTKEIELRSNLKQKLNETLEEKRILEVDRDTLLDSSYAVRILQNYKKVFEEHLHGNEAIRENLKITREKLNIISMDLELGQSDTLNDKNSLDMIEKYFHELEMKFENERQLFHSNIRKETEKVINKDKVIKNLQNEKTALKGEYAVLLHKLKTEIIRLKDEALNLKSEVDHMTSLREELKGDLGGFISEKKVLEDTIKKLGNEKCVLKIDGYMQLENDLEVLVTENEFLRNENGLKIEEVRKENKRLNIVYKVLENDLEVLVTENEVLDNEKVELINKNMELSKENERLRIEKKKIQNDKDLLLDELTDLLTTLEIVNENYDSEKTVLRERYEVLLNEMKIENIGLKDEALKLKSKLDQMASLGEKLRDDLELLIAQNKNFEDRNEELRNEKEGLSNGFEQCIRKLETELESGISEVQKETIRIQEHEALVVSIYKENETLRGLAENQKENIEILRSEKKLLLEHLENATNKLDDTTRDIKSERDHTLELKEQLEAVKNNLHSYEVKFQREREEKHSNELKLSKLQKEFEEKESNELKLLRDLEEVLFNLQRESNAIENHEQMVESLENELVSELSEMISRNNLLEIDVSNLRDKIDQLISDKNKFECLNTDVLILEDNLELAIEMTKLLSKEAVSINSSTSHSKSHETGEENITLKKMDNLIVEQLEQKNEILLGKLKSKECELEQLRKANENIESIMSPYVSKKSYDHISNVCDGVKVELAALKQDIEERNKRQEDLRTAFEQEKQHLEASIRQEQKKNGQILETMEEVIENFNQKSLKMKTRIQKETAKNKELVKILAKLGVKYDGKSVFDQGDQSSTSYSKSHECDS